MRKMKIMKAILALTIMFAALFAEDGIKPVPQADSSNVDYLTKKVEQFMSKAGVNFSGQFKSRMLTSSLNGNLTDLSPKAGKYNEDILYTSVDFEVGVRPNDIIGGKLILRMHEDWRNVFASMSSPLTTRWISIDGNAKNMFFYNAGDYKVKFTTLTLWAPEPEIMYEPYIFSRQRADVMNEVFAGDNNRVLQGVNLNFLAQALPAFNETHLNVFGARLRKQGSSADTVGYRPTAVDASLMDRYSTGADLYFKFLDGVEVGGTFLYTGDALGTYVDGSEIDGKAIRSQNMVYGGRLGLGTSTFGVDNSVIDAKIFGEYAGTNDKRYDKTIGEYSYKGMAVNGGLDLSVVLGGAGNLHLNGKYIYTDDAFRNEMAQSPVLYKKQIMNTAANVDAYSSFDAMYKQVFKYTPAEGETGIKQPTQKIAWTRGIMTYDEISKTAKNGEIENYLTPVMPFGDATPNRNGFASDLGLDFLDKAILVSGKFKLFNEIVIDTVMAKNINLGKFMQYGGGASIDLAKLGGFWSYPIVLSGSYLHSDVDNGLTTSAGQFSEVDYDFINGGLYFKFYKKAALIGGYQMINSTDNMNGPDRTLTQMQWAGGLEYTVAEGGKLTGTVGQIGNTYSGGGRTVSDVNSEFNAFQVDLFLTVSF